MFDSRNELYRARLGWRRDDVLIVTEKEIRYKNICIPSPSVDYMSVGQVIYAHPNGDRRKMDSRGIIPRYYMAVAAPRYPYADCFDHEEIYVTFISKKMWQSAIESIYDLVATGLFMTNIEKLRNEKEVRLGDAEVRDDGMKLRYQRDDKNQDPKFFYWRELKVETMASYDDGPYLRISSRDDVFYAVKIYLYEETNALAWNSLLCSAIDRPTRVGAKLSENVTGT